MNVARRACLFGLLGLFACPAAFAEPLAVAPPAGAATTTQPGPTFSVDRALEAMRREQPLLRAATSDIRAAQGNAVTSGHWTNPVLDATYMKAVRNSSYDSLGAPVIGVTQFLEFSGAPAARRRSAEAEVHATTADRESITRDLEWGVREAFVHLVAAYEREKIRKNVLGDLEHARAIVHSRVDGGLAPRYDASRIDIALEQARAELADAAASIVRARADLDIVVGPGARELVGMPEYDLASVPSIPPLPPGDVAARRPDVVASNDRARAADQDVSAARRSVFPGLGVRVGAGYGQGPGQVDLGVGVVVPLPILERGQGTVVTANARADASRERARALSFTAQKQIGAALGELDVRVSALTAYREHVAKLNESARAEAEAGYREAKLSVLELVDAYSSLRDARLRLVDMSEAAHVARVDLGRALGAGDR